MASVPTEEPEDSDMALVPAPAEESAVVSNEADEPDEVSDEVLNQIMDNLPTDVFDNPVTYQPGYFRNCTFTGPVNFYFNK